MFQSIKDSLQSQHLDSNVMRAINWFIVDFMSRHPSIFIRRHLILIKGIVGAAVGRDMFGNRSGDCITSVASREETRQLSINDRR